MPFAPSIALLFCASDLLEVKNEQKYWHADVNHPRL